MTSLDQSPRPAAPTNTAALASRPDAAPGALSNGQQPIALIDLTLPQLAAAYHGLDRLEHEYENMSGICATLKGLVLIEAKAKPENKQRFMAWVKESFSAGCHRTATRYMRLAEAFSKGLDSTVQFQTLTRDLASSVEALKQFQLDLSHPVVARVARWVNGRGAYQLMLDFPGSKGGDTSCSHKRLSSAEKHAQFLQDCRTDFADAVMALDRIADKELWKAPSIADLEREAAAELCHELSRNLRAWNKIPDHNLIGEASISQEFLEVSA